MAPKDDAAGGTANTLICSSAGTAGVFGHLADRLPDVPLEELEVTFVAHALRSEEVLERWLRHADRFPRRLDVIDVGGMTRSVSSRTGSITVQPNVSITTESPEDLTGLEIELSEAIVELDPTTHHVVCFDSLTTMLQYVDVESAYRFLLPLVGRVHATNAIGLFHIDPAAHESRTVETMKSLFDDVLEPE